MQVDVAAAPGDYVNGAQNITARAGLDPPATDATVTFQAPPPPPPPDAKRGTSVTIARSLGTVRVQVPGSATYVDVTSLTEVPLGSRIDTRKGRVTLAAEVDAKTGRTQSTWFYDGIFDISQTKGTKPYLVATLAGGTFAGCAPRRGASTRVRPRHGREPDPLPVRRQAQQAQGPPPVGRGRGPVPHGRTPLDGDRPRHVVARRGSLRRHAHARQAGPRRRPRPAAEEDDQAARRQALHLSREGAVSARARLRCGLAAALLALGGGGLARAADAEARIATGGSGRFLDTIDWLEWGTPFQADLGRRPRRART